MTTGSSRTRAGKWSSCPRVTSSGPARPDAGARPNPPGIPS